MLTAGDVADVHGDAACFFRSLGFSYDDDVPGAWALCAAATGAIPAYAPIGRAEAAVAKVHGRYRVFLSRGATTAREAWLIGHELGHTVYNGRVSPGPFLEALCDAFGAAVTCPRRPFVALTRRFGHSPKRLSRLFGVTASCALLRVGETTGRPVVLLTRRPVVRGDAYAWPEGPQLRDAIRTKPNGIHPVRLADERLWGLMAAA